MSSSSDDNKRKASKKKRSMSKTDQDITGNEEDEL
jgi:hypothetical protein